jgi:hypothetical protein
MSTIVIGGDAATTTAIAIAAGWPDGTPEVERDVFIVEADPTGGSLAAWLDTPLSPSLSSLVTALHHGGAAGATRPTGSSTVDAMIRRSTSGIGFVPAPFRSRAARAAINEAEVSYLPHLADADHKVALIDVGRIDPVRPPHSALNAELALLIHRQDPSSARATTVRVERLAETIEALDGNGARVGLAVIGNDPFALSEVVDFTGLNGPAWTLAPDPLSAAVLAGRTGVSARRLARLPLMRSAVRIAADLAAMVEGRSERVGVGDGGPA